MKKDLMALAAVALAATASATTCPPKGWEKCSQSWPPPADGHCCSTSGWLGNTPAHCSNIDVLEASGNKCCVKSKTNPWKLDCFTGDKSDEEEEKDDSSSEEEASGECPPKEWVERCGKVWPPPSGGHCCSSAGWMGNSKYHCDLKFGGINALADSGNKCCAYNEFTGKLDCHLGKKKEKSTACVPPPDNCTGDEKIDAILKKSDIGCTIGLTKKNAVYTWDGFCKAIRQYNNISDRQIYLGEGSCQAGLSNIAALLAQTMWESGGDSPFTACDENNYTKSPTAACSQRGENALYADDNDKIYACPVDPNMKMTAVTYADFTDGPMKCAPGTVTEGCCWWGRGAIQTTGPNNYGYLNQEVFGKIPALQHINLCKNPEGICDTSDGNTSKNWLGAIHYWAHNVQGYSDKTYRENFHSSLKRYVEGGLNLTASIWKGQDFPSGTGAVVNNGYWSSTAHANKQRVDNFKLIIKEFKEAGMGTCY